MATNHSMKHLHLSTYIQASRDRVWDTMLDDATYREWTNAFNPGSYYEGSWEQGSLIRFLGADESGSGVLGMSSRIAESRRPEFVSIEHLGILTKDGVDTTSEFAQAWAGAHENYTFAEKDSGTELTVDVDVTETEYDMMEAMWQKALVRLKQLAEA